MCQSLLHRLLLLPASNFLARRNRQQGKQIDMSLAKSATQIFLLIVALSSGFEARAGNVFKIANFPVESSAKNAVLAKKQAISDGQTAAYRSLLKRLVPVTAYSQLDRLKNMPAANLIDSMEVRSERNSSTTYIASLDFVFRADAVRSTLRRQGIPFVDSPARLTILVPVYRQKPGHKAQQGLGAWGAILKSLDLENTITPIDIRALQSNIAEEVVSAIDSDASSLTHLLRRKYKSSQVVIALAERDSRAQKLNVHLVGRDGTGPISLSRSYRVFDGDYGFARELAAIVSLGILEGRWKETRQPNRDRMGFPNVSHNIILKVEFQSPSQWYRIQRQIADLPGVESLKVSSVSALSADIFLNYPGGGAQLASVLTRHGYSMNDLGSHWLLRPSF